MKPPLPRIFEGQICIVCAGGPSLRGFDWSRLAGRRVIAINRALEDVPTAPVLWWSDARFWNRHASAILAHRAAIKATTNVNYGGIILPDSVTQYRVTGHDGLDEDPRCLRHGNNSTYAATHMARHLGARRVIILGLDMRHGPGGASHYHSGHGFQAHEETLADLMIPYFPSLAKALSAERIEVINASPDSALTCWPRCSIDEGLAEYERG